MEAYIPITALFTIVVLALVVGAVYFNNSGPECLAEVKVIKKITEPAHSEVYQQGDSMIGHSFFSKDTYLQIEHPEEYFFEIRLPHSASSEIVSVPAEIYKLTEVGENVRVSYKTTKLTDNLIVRLAA